MSRAALAWIATVEALLIAVLAVALSRGDEAGPVEMLDAEREAAVHSRSPTAAAATEPTPAPVSGRAPAAPTPSVITSRPASAIEGTVLFGTVTCAGGKGYARSIGLRRIDVPDATPPQRVSVMGRRDEYAIPGLAPGRYELHATTHAHRDAIHVIEIAPDTDRLRFDVVLAKTWDLRVLLVTPDDTPLSDALRAAVSSSPELMWVQLSILATLAAPPSPIPNVTTHSPQIGLGQWHDSRDPVSDGQPRLSKRYAGRLSIPVDVPCFVSAVLRSAVLATARVEAGQEEVRLVVAVDDVLRSYCRVRLRVVDGETAAPVTTVRVALNNLQRSGEGQPVDAQGRIELRAQPGVHHLDVSSSTAAMRTWSLEARPGETTDLGDVPLRTPREIELRFEGVPAGERAWCYVKSLEAPPHQALRARWLAAGPERNGKTMLRVVPGRHTLRATAGTAVAIVDFDTQSLGDAPLVVRLEPAAVLRIIPPPLERAVSLTLTDTRGTAAWRGTTTWTEPVEIPLLPGRYEAAIDRPDGSVEHRTLVLGTGKSELDLR